MSLAASRVYAEDPNWNDKRAAKETTFAGRTVGNQPSKS